MKRSVVVVLAMIFTFALAINRGVSTSAALSSADLRAQSNGLQAQIDANNKKAQALAEEADSLRRTIESLDIQIDSFAKQIELINVKISELEIKLKEAEAELARQKELLKATLQAVYERSGVSSFELLMATDSFTTFVNEQEYLGQLQSAVKQSTEKVIALKQQIETQKLEQENLRKEREGERQGLESTKSDRADLLTQTEGEEAKYLAVMDSLLAEQAAVNRRLFEAVRLESGDGSNGGYPYADWPHTMKGPGCPAGDGPDRWGYCTRQCVSYAAWAVERSGRQAPMWWGDAHKWDDRARDAGYRVDKVPEAGAVAVYNGGGWGHVQYVEEVYGNGMMRISQYNANLTGEYSEADVSQSAPDWFIHF